MKYVMKAIVFLLSVLFFMPTLVSGYDADEAAMIHKPLALPGGKKGDPFSMYYPIELTSPGEIRVLVRVDDIDPDPVVHNLEPLRAIIVDSRAFKKMEPSEWKKFCVTVNKYNAVEWIAGDEIRDFVKGVKRFFGKEEKPPAYFHGEIACGREGKSESMKHAVDSHELATTKGRYVVIIRNIEAFRVNGGIMIEYPGTAWDFDPTVTKSAKVYPDLMVEDANLNSSGVLEVRLKNGGKGVLHKGYWHLEKDKAVTLSVKAGGRNYIVTLQAFDPKKQLEKPGGATTYAFEQIRNIRPDSVSVTIDQTDQVFEEDENNNTLAPRLIGLKPAGVGSIRGASMAGGKPDLTVTSIRLNAARVIEVEVRNSGNASLDPSLWMGGNTPHLNLMMNGNGWSNVQLGMLDPARNLGRPGGTTVYSTGYVLRQKAEISATIDAANLIEETDENNNTLQVMLQP